MIVFGCTSSDTSRPPHSLATMNPSSGHSINAYSQPSQFRSLYQPTTSQPQLVSPDIPPVYSDLTTLASTRPNHAQPHTTSPSFKALRPQSPSELGERAEQSLGDAARPLKTWLRVAEEAKRHANRFQEQGDFESAFFEFCRAALILLERIPSHPDYKVILTPTQRHNVGMVSFLHPLAPHILLVPELPCGLHIVHIDQSNSWLRCLYLSGFSKALHYSELRFQFVWHYNLSINQLFSG